MPSAVAKREGTNVVKDGADYFYAASTGAVGLSNGLWGIMRAYKTVEPSSLQPLVNNPEARFPEPINYEQEFNNAYAKNPKATQTFRVVATTAAKALPEGKLIYNPRADRDPNQKVSYSDPNAVLFVRESDLDNDGKLKNGVRVEPLILRAAAGDWIKVTLINNLVSDPKSKTFTDGRSFRYGNPFNSLPRLPGDQDPNKPPPNVGEVNMTISQQVGLHPQLLAFDVTKANGINVGFNPDSTIGPGALPAKLAVPPQPGKPLPAPGTVGAGDQPANVRDFYWYAGEIVQTNGKINATPVEFGATNLVGADLILQTQFGLVGALVVEPHGATWIEDPGTHAFAKVTKSDSQVFHECVLVMQNMVSNQTPGRETLASQLVASQLEGREQGFGAVNYRTENFASRNIATVGNPTVNPDVGFAQAFSNSLLPPPNNPPDPETPVFTVPAGAPTRFRVVMPSTTSANSAAQPIVFAIHGHGWQDEPYVDRSKSIGHNDMAQFIGSQEVTVTQKYDIVIDSAGGPFQVPGDYLYQAFSQEQKMGIWGLFRVKK
jgi:hypothetical protein